MINQQDCLNKMVVGSKFHADGSLCNFPGNSIISVIEPDQAQFSLLQQVDQQIMARNFANKFTLLPASSFHMTVIDLICDKVRTSEHWSTKISLDAPFEEAEKQIIHDLKDIKPPGPLNMRYKSIGNHNITLHLILEPADMQTEMSLKNYRNQVARATGIRHPNHDSYAFHISICYLFRFLNDQENNQLSGFKQQLDTMLASNFGILRLPPPQLVFFNHMFAFPTQRQKDMSPGGTSAKQFFEGEQQS